MLTSTFPTTNFRIPLKFGKGKKSANASFVVNNELTEKSKANVAAGKPPLFKAALKAPELTVQYAKL